MRVLRPSTIVASLVACAFFFISSDGVHADESGVKIVPAFIEERADPGIVINRELVVSNLSPTAKELYLYVRNIKGVEAGGVPVFATVDSEPTGYEIADWVTLEESAISFAAGETKTIPITIRVPDNATPGSHFGGVFVSAEPPRFRELGASVGFQVATILSIRINGDLVDDARIRSFSTDRLFYGSKNVQFAIRVENQGNILIRPRGPLTISSAFGGQVGSLIVNDAQAGVFPGSVRDFNVTWEDESIGFGKYEAVIALNYDGKDGQRTIDSTVVFWIFPLNIMLSIVGVFLFIVLGGYLFTRYYIRRAIMRAAGDRRIVPQRYRRQVGVSRLTVITIGLLGLVVFFLLLMLIFFA